MKGLKGLKYFDNVDGIDNKSESEEAIGINGETDRIYKGASDTITVSYFTRLPSYKTNSDVLVAASIALPNGWHCLCSLNFASFFFQIEDSGTSQQIKIEKRGFPDAVLWNPWTAKSKGMADFGDEEYKVCSKISVKLTLSGSEEQQVSDTYELASNMKRHCFLAEHLL